MLVYAIQQISTRQFLPAPSSGRGGTYVKPEPDCLPRLFLNERAAKCALTAWCKGYARVKTDTDDDFFGNPFTVQTGVYYEAAAGRDPADMHVIPLYLVDCLE